MLVGFDASRAFASEATGTENYSLNLLRALAKIDKKNRYRVYMRGSSRFTVHGSRFKKTVNSQLITDNFSWPRNFEFVQVRPNRLWTQLGLALETWRNPVDVLFIPAHTLPILRKPNVKTVVTIHDLGVEYLPSYHQFPQRYYLDLASKYAAREADALIAVSKATRADLIKRYRVDAKKVFVVPEGVDIGFFRPLPKPKVESVKSKYKIQGNYVLAVGTVQPRKNLEMLIRAFAKLVHGSRLTVHGRKETVNSQLRTVNLIIAGKLGWDYQKIIDLPNKLGIGDRVKFLGYVDFRDMPALYTGASVFAAPSLFEGFDLPILEALACGCAVVASDIGPHREILAKISRNFKLTAFLKAAEPMVLVKPKDVDRWTQVLYQYISLYNNRLILESKKGRIEAARSVLSTQYSWEKTARETLKVFL